MRLTDGKTKLVMPEIRFPKNRRFLLENGVIWHPARYAISVPQKELDASFRWHDKFSA